MNKFFAPFLLAAVALAGCSQPAQNAADTASASSATPEKPAKLVVAATAVPHAEVLEIVEPLMQAQGIEINVHVFNDYVQPNDQLVQKQVDVNYFQTGPYLEAYNRERGTDLTIITGVHIEPMAAYSQRFKTLDELPQGAQVALPNDPSNNSRALILLHNAGLIKLADPENALTSQDDIIENPKQLNFREMDTPMLPRVLDQLDLAVINTNYAMGAGLDPVRDGLVMEKSDSPYVNFLVARADNQDDARIQALAQALTSPQVKAFMEEKYNGAVLPAF